MAESGVWYRTGVYTQSLRGDALAAARLADQTDGAASMHLEGKASFLHELELGGDLHGALESAAADLAVALCRVGVADRAQCAGDLHRQVERAAGREVPMSMLPPPRLGGTMLCVPARY